MAESDLRALMDQARSGALPRRLVLRQLVAWGLPAPVASVLLMDAGVAQAQAAPYAPTKRGGGGALKLLFWQGPTLLNPHFATGTKDLEGSRIFYEPLATWDPDGDLEPVLAAELPSRSNGGLSADGRSATWRLKKNVTWHDGQPFSADDVVFNWRYAVDPAAAAVTSGAFAGLKIEKLDAHTVRVVFDKPAPFWPGSYCSVLLIPKHLFAAYGGARSREAPQNLAPLGTGPYRFVDFKPGDLVRGVLYAGYHQPNRPHFDSIELKGGGDAASAARAVLQTGEYDYAWNLQVEDEVLKRMEAAGKGRVTLAPGGSIELIQLNAADPNTEVEGERAHPRSRHPAFSEPAVRQALALLVDRAAVQQYIYGRAGVATPNYLNNPARFRSANLKPEFNIDKANAVLDAAGWKRGTDGVREKAGRKLRLVFQTSTNANRQKTQAIVKQACQKAGIELELKSVTGSVFFSSDLANPDTSGKFWADLQMFTQSQGKPDPERLMQVYVSWEIASKANQWLGRNQARWSNPEYDRAYRESEAELDPVKRAALFIRMNDLLCNDQFVLPLVYRPDVAAVGRKLVARLSGWDNALSALHDWHRES